MNERIKELMEQAGMNIVDDKFSTYGKFADLIVAECAALAKSKSEYIQSMETDDRGDQAQIHSLAWQFEEFGYEIKKHFGVGEQVTESNEWHTCPYAEEIHNDYETLCDCDEEQQRQCAADI